MFDILLKNSELYGMQVNMFYNGFLFLRKYFSVYVLLVLIIFFSICSCKKEKENKAPEISIQLPQSEISLDAIDSVLVNVSITDDNGPLVVSVSISDAQANSLNKKPILYNHENLHQP